MQYMRKNLEVLNDKENADLSELILGTLNSKIKCNESDVTDGSTDSDNITTYTSSPLSPTDAYLRHQGTSLLKKFPGYGNGGALSRIDKAYKKFLEAEVSCKEWNRSLVNGLDPAACEFLVRVAKRIHRILGPAPTYTDLGFSFGPGSSSNCAQTSVRFKLNAIPSVSNVRSLTAARQFMETCPTFNYFHKGRVDVVPAKLTFVPKNSLIDRPIIIEPSLNTGVQKGIGSFIRSRLLKIGVDLNHGQALNRSAAREGSFTGSLSTIDLSSASDRIPYGLIREVLPADWFSLLNDWRSDTITIPKALRGKYIKDHALTLNKFSSMGNGFTFELESLLFYAIVLESAVSERRSDVIIYGDDIIIHTDDYVNAVNNLLLCNFVTNNSKSFTGDSPFRESCGGDYYYGYDVTPFYLKEKWSEVKAVEFLNHLRSKSVVPLLVLDLIYSYFSLYFRLKLDSGPPGYGRGYFHAYNFRKESVSSDLSGFFITTIVNKPVLLAKNLHLNSDGILLASYRSMFKSSDSSFDLRQTRGVSNKTFRKRIYIL